MSEENVEIVRELFDALSRRDSERVLGLYDPEVEIDGRRGVFSEGLLFEGRVYRGYEGLRAIQRQLVEAFQSIDTYCDELVDAGREVVSVSHYQARGRESGIEIEGPRQYGVWTIRDGKIARVVWYPTRDEAIRAAGLSE